MSYAAYPAQREHKDFLVLVEDYCTPENVSFSTQFTPVTLNYVVGQASPETSSFVESWTTVPAVCNLMIKETIDPLPDDPNMITSS